MKFVYCIRDNFETEAHVDKYKVINEDQDYLYCSPIGQQGGTLEWVFDKNEIYKPHMAEKGFCNCWGYDVDLVDLQIMKFRKKLLDQKPSWKNSAERAFLIKRIEERQRFYEQVLLNN